MKTINLSAEVSFDLVLKADQPVLVTSLSLGNDITTFIKLSEVFDEMISMNKENGVLTTEGKEESLRVLKAIQKMTSNYIISLENEE